MQSATVRWFASLTQPEKNQVAAAFADELFLSLAEELRADGNPRIVTSDWLDLVDPAIVLYRGVSSRDRERALVYGELHVTNGQYMGAGIYASRSDNPAVALSCAMAYSSLGLNDGRVLRMGLEPGSNIGMFKTILQLRDNAKRDLRHLFTELMDTRTALGADTSEIRELESWHGAAQWLYNDVGRFALSHGWDAVAQIGTAAFPDEYIVLNRSKLIVVQ